MTNENAEPTGDEAVESGAEDGPVDLDVEAIGEELAAAEGFVEERVQRALDRFRGVYPPAVLDEFADDLRCYLLTHPVASQMLARIRPRAERAASGEGVIMNVIGDDAANVAKGGGG